MKEHTESETNSPVTMEEKYKPLYEALAVKEASIVLIASAEIIGDNYEELVYNLNKIADSGKMLGIATVKK